MIPRDVLYEHRLLCVTPPMLMIIVHDGKNKVTITLKIGVIGSKIFFYHIKFEKKLQ